MRVKYLHKLFGAPLHGFVISLFIHPLFMLLWTQSYLFYTYIIIQCLLFLIAQIVFSFGHQEVFQLALDPFDKLQ